MKTEQLTDGHRRAVIIFAGWGMDANPFRGLTMPGYDLYLSYDYDGELPGVNTFKGYVEVGIVAWSYGVAAAAKFIALHGALLPLTVCVAVNGVIRPVDESEGMPEETFEGTLAGLSERSMYKFYRRMFDSAEAFAPFQQSMPSRPLESLRNELVAYRDIDLPAAVDKQMFDRVYISSSDRIIPPEAQQRCWMDHPGKRFSPGGHMPDFSKLLRVTFRDKELVKERFEGAAETYGPAAVPQRRIAEKLRDFWRKADNHTGIDMMEFGVGTGYYTSLYRECVRPRSLRLIDIAPTMPGVETADAETAIMDIPPDSMDVITAASALQWLNSPKRFISRAATALRHGGLLVLSTFADGHFPELRPYLASPLPLPDIDEVNAWSMGLEPLIVESDELTLRFDTPRQMLRHLRLTGVNALGGGAGRIREMLRNSSAAACTLTYKPIYLILRKP